MKKRPRPTSSAPLAQQIEPGRATPPLTIARTLAKHQNDPEHHFHTPTHLADGRIHVAAGERMQRVRARSHR